MRVIYVDEIFIENLLIDYILLILTAKIAGVNVKRTRALLAACIGGGYAVFSALKSIDVFENGIFKILIGILMVTVAFWNYEKTGKICVLFFGVSAAFAGAVMAVAMFKKDEFDFASGVIPFDVLLSAFIISVFVFKFVFRQMARNHVESTICKVKVFHNSKTADFSALIDTGNSLVDPISGWPVAICDLDTIERLFSEHTAQLIKVNKTSPEEVVRACGDEKFRLIPYRAVGTASGLLLAFKPDAVEINRKRAELVIAMSPECVSDGSGYSAIVGSVN